MSLADLSQKTTSSDSYISEIRKLSDRLGPPEVVSHGPGLKQYETISGKALAWTIHWQEEFAICHAFLAEGTVLQWHTHDQKEWLICVQGQLYVRTEENEICLMPTQEAILDPKVSHEVCCFSDTYVLAITMPAAPEYPK
jgi:quercetin dioxygenase-like cupin family protein